MKMTPPPPPPSPPPLELFQKVIRFGTLNWNEDAKIQRSKKEKVFQLDCDQDTPDGSRTLHGLDEVVALLAGRVVVLVLGRVVLLLLDLVSQVVKPGTRVEC